MPHAQHIEKRELFAELGYAGDFAPYEVVLQSLGISRPEKRGIALSKRERVRAALERAFIRVCPRGDCAAGAKKIAGSRTAVPAASQKFCEVCAGSANRDAMLRAAAAMKTRGWTKLCVVGGFPATIPDLREIERAGVALRTVDGTRSRTTASAQADMEWADLVVLWGATPLDHSVSRLYKGEKVVSLSARGVTRLGSAIVRASGGA